MYDIIFSQINAIVNSHFGEGGGCYYNIKVNTFTISKWIKLQFIYKRD
jgi:hypothetical protein